MTETTAPGAPGSRSRATGRHGARTPNGPRVREPSRRAVLTSAALASSLLLALAGGSIAAARAEVTLEVDGVSRPIVVWGGTVARVLDEAGITTGPHDLVQPELGSRAPDGGIVVVRTAHPYTLDIDGEQTSVWSTSTSADAVLADTAHLGDSVLLAADRSSSREVALGLVSRAKSLLVVVDGHEIPVEAGPGDDVDSVLARAGAVPAPNDRVSFTLGADGVLRLILTRVTRGESTSTVAVPFTERDEASAELFAGESRIIQRGVEGSALLTRWRETVGGEATAETTTAQTLTRAPMEQIRATGTKEATPAALLAAGIDPKAQLETGTDENGDAFTAYTAAVGTLSTRAEIQTIINAITDEDERAAAAAGALNAGIDVTYAGQDPKEIARIKAAARGWGAEQFQCLVSLWNKESHWNPYAENASSGAYGIPQALPGSKMASAGADWRTNPATQITWGIGYIAGRYGTPCAAWGHSTATGWY